MFNKLFVPAVLSSTVVIGIIYMQSVTNDIKKQCNYGIKFDPCNYTIRYDPVSKDR